MTTPDDYALRERLADQIEPHAEALLGADWTGRLHLDPLIDHLIENAVEAIDGETTHTITGLIRIFEVDPDDPDATAEMALFSAVGTPDLEEL